MTPRALQDFVDEELFRAPLVAESILTALLESLKGGHGAANGADRKVIADLLLGVASNRPRLVERYVAALRQGIEAELGRLHLPPSARGDAAPARGLSLALVDDQEVAEDVAQSRVLEAIKSVAEHELRDLRAYTSAMAGDPDVAGDYNPIRAEVQSRALWAMAQALPLGRAHQLACMRLLAQPAAQALRKAYAAACARLDDAGHVPAHYRTVIPPAGARTRRVMDPTLNESAGVQAFATTSQPATRSLAGRLPEETPAEGPGTIDLGERQLVAMVGRIFAAMLADARLPTELHAPLSRIQGLTLLTTRDDPTLLQQRERPLWVFMDHLAFQASVYPGPDGQDLADLLRFVGKLMDQLADQARHTDTLYRWALDRLERFAASRLAQAQAAAAEQIEALRQLEFRLVQPDATVSTLHGTLDVAQLDTVPAALMETAPPPDRRDPSRWLLELQTGHWLRLFHRGQWALAQLLWIGEQGELWLLRDGATHNIWPIRRSALRLLREERLASVARPRSLLADALQSLDRRR
jgi:hypothetical protein